MAQPILALIVPLGDGIPGIGIGGQLPVYPDQGLPGGSGGRPSHPIHLPPYPDNTLPPGSGVGGTPEHPIYNPPYPDQGLPGGSGGRPDQGLPPQGGSPPMPSHPIYVPGTPEHPIASPPGTIWPPLPPDAPQGKTVVLVYVSGVGYRWTVVDTSLKPDNTLPAQPARPDQGLPPTAQPKTKPV